MEPATAEIFHVFRSIARESRIVSQDQIIAALKCHHDDCERLLDELVAAGMLRRTQSHTGQKFYWLTQLGTNSPEGQA